jgi:peptide deformylase
MVARSRLVHAPFLVEISQILDRKPRNPYLGPMSVRPILTAPDPRLKAVSTPVARVDDDIRKLIADMLESMYAAEGIGLAAIQIGVPKRVLVMDLAQKEGRREPRAFINPKILWASEETTTVQEGCLSVPDIWEEVDRPARIRAEYLDRDGTLQILEADGLLATCLQHEMDHLEGVLFLDHLSKLKRSIALRKLQKAKRLEKAG